MVWQKKHLHPYRSSAECINSLAPRINFNVCISWPFLAYFCFEMVEFSLPSWLVVAEPKQTSHQSRENGVTSHCSTWNDGFRHQKPCSSIYSQSKFIWVLACHDCWNRWIGGVGSCELTCTSQQTAWLYEETREPLATSPHQSCCPSATRSCGSSSASWQRYSMGHSSRSLMLWRIPYPIACCRNHSYQGLTKLRMGLWTILAQAPSLHHCHRLRLWACSSNWNWRKIHCFAY